MDTSAAEKRGMGFSQIGEMPVGRQKSKILL